MKFNCRAPKCYIAYFKCLFAILTVYVFDGLKFWKKPKIEQRVMIYSHMFSGNIKAFFDYCLDTDDL